MDNKWRNIQIYAGYIIVLILTVVFWTHNVGAFPKRIATGALIIETPAIIYFEYLKWKERKLYL